MKQHSRICRAAWDYATKEWEKACQEKLLEDQRAEEAEDTLVEIANECENCLGRYSDHTMPLVSETHRLLCTASSQRC